MRAFLAWTVAAVLSVLLGITLYSTSLQGSATGYQEAVYTPRPAPTVVKTRVKTKIVRMPGKTKYVYVPQPAPQAPVQSNTTTSSSQSDSTTAGVQLDSSASVRKSHEREQEED